MNGNSGFKNFLVSPTGQILLFVILYTAIWGITYALWTVSEGLGAIAIIACAVAGWQALNRIQPAMFLWMSWIGWLVYFLVKFVLSAVLGLFIAPYYLAKRILNSINESM